MTAIYVIEYYEEDPRFHWSNTKHDNVLASSEEKAKEKFKKKHPNNQVFTVVNVYRADY